MNDSFSLADFNENRNIIKILISLRSENENEIKNKLWKLFLRNDGSMTKMLQILYDNKLKLDLISNNLCRSEIASNSEYLYDLRNIIEILEPICNLIYV